MPDTPEPVHGIFDPTRIDQVLSNLISNALKYSPVDGTISLETESGAGSTFMVHLPISNPREEAQDVGGA